MISRANYNLKVTGTVLFWLILSLSLCGATAKAQDVTLKLDRASFKTILKEIETRTGYYFLYNEQLVSNKTNISVDYKDQSIQNVMSDLSGRLNFQFKIVDKTITIHPPSTSTTAQQSISGVLYIKNPINEQHEAAANATIHIKGKARTSKTNEDGHFTISANIGEVLVFSYIGYEKREYLIQNTSYIEITLDPSIASLEEVIVGGYGIKEAKENQIGSAYRVTSKDLERKPAQRIDRLLEGLVPGFEISSQDENNSSVRPRYRSRIRGEASVSAITSNEPLWIIDGVRINTGGPTNLLPGLENSISPLSFLNPEDIESITVLKDASATTIYGANGSNGVILITTKKGTGKSKINYSHRSGLNQITKNRFQVLSADEYNGMLADMGYHNYISNQSTDWFDTYYKNSYTSQHNLSFSGSELNGLSHYVSAGVFKDNMTIIGNNTERYSLRTNIEKPFGDRVTFHLVTGGSYTINKMFNPGDNFYMNRPTFSPYNEEGTALLRDDRGVRIFNHPIEAEQNDNKQNAFWTQANGGLTVKLLEGLNIRTENGIEINSSNENSYKSMLNLSGYLDKGYARKSQANSLRWISSNTLTYHQPIALGDLDIVVGMEASEIKSRYTGATGSNFAYDWIREVSYAPELSRRGTSGGSEQSSLSYFGRINYIWDKRYALTASMRKDGDSNFGSDIKWGTFAAAGFAWTVSNESFWNDDAFMDFLKVKITYGNNGNSRFSGDYSSGIYSLNSEYSYNGEPGGTMTRGVNDVLKWENTYMLNAGVDFRMGGLLDVAIEYYYNKTTDLIDDGIVSLTSGQRRVYQNSGKVSNTGLELILSARSLKLGQVTWSPKIILSGNRNKVLELPEGVDRSTGTTIRRVGYPAGSHYLVRWAGVDPRDGSPMWYDINGNITHVFSANNRVIVGTSTPDFYGSLNNSISYKNFFLSGMILFTKGGLAFSSLRRNSESDGLNLLVENQSKNSLDYWKSSGDLALNPRLSAISMSSTLNSTRHLHDKTHVRIQNASLGYSFTEQQLKSLFLSSLSFYIQADNLGFWTPYQSRKDRNTYRNSFDPWPEVRSLSLGTSITF